jgi:hypothetical protein
MSRCRSNEISRQPAERSDGTKRFRDLRLNDGRLMRARPWAGGLAVLEQLPHYRAAYSTTAWRGSRANALAALAALAALGAWGGMSHFNSQITSTSRGLPFVSFIPLHRPLPLFSRLRCNCTACCRPFTHRLSALFPPSHRLHPTFGFACSGHR